MRKRHTYKRHHERQNDIILTALGQRSVSARHREFTNAKMAKWLGMAASTKLKRMLDELVEEGFFKREEKVHRSSVNKDGYQLTIMKHVYSFSDEGLERLAII